MRLKTLLSILVLSLFFLKPFSFLWAATKDFWDPGLTNNIVINPFQGLGICHWASPTIYDDPSITWAYDAGEATWWDQIEPAENQFNWQPMDNLVNLAKSKGKKIWLQAYNDGKVPLWARNKLVNGEKMVLMGTANNPADPCHSMNPRLPLPWNKAYQALWRKVIHKMAERYDNDPAVEAIVIMAGGGYGEMVICSTCGPSQCWDYYAAPESSNSKFIQAVKDLTDIYLEKEYTWGNDGVLPAGTKTHGFINKPIILQLGGGASVIKPVLDYALPKYGMRVLLKTNGWHCGSCNNTPCDWGHSGIAQDYLTGNNPNHDRTKFGLEPAAWLDSLSDFQAMVECRNQASYACLQSFYWESSRQAGFKAARDSLAKNLGSKVGLKSVTYPEVMTVGQDYQFSLSLKNLGSIPPFRPKRTQTNGTVKEIASSYQLSFQLIKENQIAFRKEIDLNPPSIGWTQNQEITITPTLSFDGSIASGNYELRIALFDPEAADHFRQEYFRFLNKDLLDPDGRAKIGPVTVQGGSVSLTPNPSNTPSPVDPPFLDFKAKLEGVENNQLSFLTKISLLGTNFFQTVQIKNNQVFRNLELTGINPNQNYDLVLSVFPFLPLKKNLLLVSGKNPSSEDFLDFGTLKTGDLNLDHQVNGLDWSLMKLNYGDTGEE